MVEKKFGIGKGATVLLALGVILLIVAPVWKVAVVPELKQAPADLKTKVVYLGQLSLFNATTLGYDEWNITAVDSYKAAGIDGDTLHIQHEAEVTDRDTNQPLSQFYTAEDFDINRKTLAYTNETKGQWSFPIGIEKKSYNLWNDALGRTSETKFVKEEEHGGINTYKYQIAEVGVNKGPVPAELGLPQGCEFICDVNITIWVEPTSGTVIDVVTDRTEYIQFPNLRFLPENINSTSVLEGKIQMMNAATLQLETINVIVSTHVVAVGLAEDGVLKINETISVKNKDTDESLPQYSTGASYGVNRQTCEYVYIANFSTENRSGHWTFPVGILNETGQPTPNFLMWNSDLKTNVPAVYLRNEIYNGLVNVSIYEATLQNIPIGNLTVLLGYDPLPGAAVYYSSKYTYWVEPNTGVIVNMKINNTYTIELPTPAELYFYANTTATAYGTLGILNETTYMLDEYNITIISTVVSQQNESALQNGIVWFDESATVIHNETSAVLSQSSWASAVNITNLCMDHVTSLDYIAGKWCFPPSANQSQYTMWNPDILSTSVANFVGSVEQGGFNLSIYKIIENNRTYSTVGDVNYTYDADITYYVDLYSGVILNFERNISKYMYNSTTGMKIKIASSHIYPTAETKLIAGMAATIMQLSLSGMNITGGVIDMGYNASTIQTSITDALESSAMLNALSEQTIPAVTQHLEYTDEQVEHSAAEAKDAKFKIELIETYVPVIFGAVGILLIVVGILLTRKKLRTKKGLEEVEE